MSPLATIIYLKEVMAWNLTANCHVRIWLNLAAPPAGGPDYDGPGQLMRPPQAFGDEYQQRLVIPPTALGISPAAILPTGTNLTYCAVIDDVTSNVAQWWYVTDASPSTRQSTPGNYTVDNMFLSMVTTIPQCCPGSSGGPFLPLAGGTMTGVIVGQSGGNILNSYDGNEVISVSGETYYNAGGGPCIVATGINWPSGLAFIDNTGTLYAATGDQSVDSLGGVHLQQNLSSSPQMYYGDGTTFVDSAGSIYYPSSDLLLADASTNLYCGNSAQVLADSTASVHLWNALFDNGASSGTTDQVLTSLLGKPYWALPTYTVAVPGNWSGSPPVTLADAIDRLAAWIASNAVVFGSLGITPAP